MNLLAGPQSDPPGDEIPADPPRVRLSSLLAGLATEGEALRIHVSDVLRAIEDRAFGALALAFAIPNVLPMPPGTGILGLPLVVLSLQLAIGRIPWLPAAVRRQSLTRAQYAAIANRAVPLLERAERLLMPRLSALFHPASERLLGWFCLILSVVLFLPIPFGNMLPALAISVIALGLLERDGLWVLFGAALGCAGLILVTGSLYLLAHIIEFLARM